MVRRGECSCAPPTSILARPPRLGHWVCAQDVDGRTPMDLAKKEEVQELLKKATVAA